MHGCINERRRLSKSSRQNEQRSPNLLSLLIHQLRRKLHTKIRAHLNCEQLWMNQHDSSIHYIEEHQP